MFDKYVEKIVDKRIQAVLNDRIEDIVDKYTREALRTSLIIQEPEEIVTTPGGKIVLYELHPRSPTIVGGYIDLAGLAGEDTVNVVVEMRLKNSWKWRKFDSYRFQGVQEEPMMFLKDMFVINGIRITLEHGAGVGKKIYHCFYRRK